MLIYSERWMVERRLRKEKLSEYIFVLAILTNELLHLDYKLDA